MRASLLRSVSYDSDEEAKDMSCITPHVEAEGHGYSGIPERSGSGVALHSSEHLTAQSSVPIIGTRKRKNKAPATSISNRQAADVHARRSILSENGSRVSQQPQTKAGRTSIADNRAQAHDQGSLSWSGYDLSMIIALASPIGNLLTGSDHLKNILLLLFLIYYLHQLVEVPWRLYRSSIPRRDFSACSDSSKQGPRQAPLKGTPLAQLHSLELFYLLLTVLSPLAGAVLLKVVAQAISGDPDSLSWFSTTLFVLAAGVRPWSHFVERLQDRNRALIAIHEDDNKEMSAIVAEREAELDADLSNIKEKIDTLDHRINETTDLNSREVDDLATYIESLDTELKGLRTQFIDYCQTHDRRLDALEAYVLALQRRRSLSNGNYNVVKTKIMTFPLLSLFWEMYSLPWNIFMAAWVRAWAPYSTLERPARSRLRQNSSIRSKRHSGALEIIMEESLDSPVRHRVPSDESDYTHVGDQNGWRFSRSIKDAVVPVMTTILRPATFALHVIYLIITIPRAILRLLCLSK